MYAQRAVLTRLPRADLGSQQRLRGGGAQPATYIEQRTVLLFILISYVIISNMFANATIHNWMHMNVFPKKFVLRYRCLLICRESKII